MKKTNNSNHSTKTNIITSQRISLSTCLYLTNLNYLDTDYFNANSKTELEVCNFTKFYYIVDGLMLIDIEGEEIIANPGDLVVIPAEKSHSYGLVDNKPVTLYYADTSIRLNNRELGDVLIMPYKSHIGLTEEWVNLFKDLRRTKDDENLWAISIYHSNLITKLLIEFINNCGAKIKFRNDIDNELNNAIKYINEHFREKISIEELAHQNYISTTRFISKFKNIMGMSPKQYISILKLKQAESLLEKTQMTIQEISDDVGYYDVAQFCKAFKDFAGYTPTKYRQIAKKSSVSTNKKIRPL